MKLTLLGAGVRAPFVLRGLADAPASSVSPRSSCTTPTTSASI